MENTRNGDVCGTSPSPKIIRKPIFISDYTTIANESKYVSDNKVNDHSTKPTDQIVKTLSNPQQATQRISQTLHKFLELDSIQLETVLNPEVLYSAALCSKSQNIELKVLYSKFRAKCKSVHILLKDVDNYIQQAIQDLDQIKIDSIKKQNQQLSESLCKDMPLDIHNIQYPDGFTPNWKESVMLSGDGKIKFPFIPLVVESICPSDRDNNMELKVATYTPNEGWKFVTALRQMFWDYTKITGLANAGLQVARHFAQDLSKYLFDFYVLNSTIIPTLHTVSQPGWYEDAFVYPGDCLGKYQWIHSSPQIKALYCSKGDTSQVLQAVKYLKEIDVANIALGTLLSSSLVYLVGSDNIQVHVYGSKGGGKSTIVTTLLALFIRSNLKGAAPGPTATVAGRELFIAEHRDLPMVIEDLHQLKDPKEREQWTRFMMQFGNNDSKQRATKNLETARSNEYRGSLLTTSEYSTTSFNDGGGLQRRIAEIMAPKNMVSPDTAQWLKKIALNNYGLFGKPWIQCIQSHKDDIALMYEDILNNDLLKKYSTKVPRHLQALAVIATANIIFDVEILGIPMEKAKHQEMSCVQRIVKDLPTDVEICEHERAKPIIVDWIQRNIQKFGVSGENNKGSIWIDPKSYDTLGVIKDEEVAVNPGALVHMLQEEGFSAKTVIKALAEDGFIVRGNAAEIKKQVYISSGNVYRMYVIPKHFVFGK